MKHPKIVGYAAIWGAVSSVPRSGYHVRFAGGAFGHFTDFDDVKALWQHNWDLQLAFNGDRRNGGLLTLREDGYGLAFEIDPYQDREWIDRVVSSIRAGTVQGMSVGYKWIERRFDTLASGLVVETIMRAKLDEISPVYHPLFRETSVRLVDSPAAIASPACDDREIVRFDPRLFSVTGRRRIFRARLAVNC
jgi:HK97 family phage prohead protease